VKYKRYFQAGGTYFFTVVTCNRRKIFDTESTLTLFHQSIEYVQQKHPFEIVAYCINPDHVHMIWTLPENDHDYPTRWRLIKSSFSRNWPDPENRTISQSRISKGEKGVWQRRYWEHYIQDEIDFKNHIEYIHFNPVKHKYVNSPYEWEQSSFRDYVNDGLYASNWGSEGNMNYLDKFGKE
jgi:putative transposase